MPAQPLNKDQLEDKRRLNLFYEKWKQKRKEDGLSASQNSLIELLKIKDQDGSGREISQSALSQYLKGEKNPNNPKDRDGIPLNKWIVLAFCEVFKCEPQEISPTIAAEISQIAETAGYVDAADIHHIHTDIDLVDLKLSAGTGHISYYADKSKKLAFQRIFLLRFSKEPEKLIKAFPVSGDSMVDAHIIDGGIVLVNTHPQYQVPTHKSIVALWIDEQIFIKQLIQLNNGQWIARSKNQEKETISEYKDRLLNGDNMGIIGKVFWSCFEL